MTTPNVHIDPRKLSAVMGTIARQIVAKVEDFRSLDQAKLDEVNLEAAELDELCATLAELAEAHANIAMKAFDDSERATREAARS
jgi:hypothetical protein